MDETIPNISFLSIERNVFNIEDQAISESIDTITKSSETDDSYVTNSKREYVKETSAKVEKKKRVGKPKRPLSAYNLFFQLERRRILSGDSECKTYTPDDINHVAPSYKRSSDKRDNRKPHGKIAFAELARLIGSKWKQLDHEVRSVFINQAAEEKIIYEEEVRKWKDENQQKMIACKVEYKKSIVHSLTQIEDDADPASIIYDNELELGMENSQEEKSYDSYTFDNQSYLDDSFQYHENKNCNVQLREVPKEDNGDNYNYHNISSGSQLYQTICNPTKRLDIDYPLSPNAWYKMMRHSEQYIPFPVLNTKQIPSQDTLLSLPNDPLYWEAKKRMMAEQQMAYATNRFIQKKKYKRYMRQKMMMRMMMADPQITQGNHDFSLARNLYTGSNFRTSQMKQYPSVMRDDLPQSLSDYNSINAIGLNSNSSNDIYFESDAEEQDNEECGWYDDETNFEY